MLTVVRQIIIQKVLFRKTHHVRTKLRNVLNKVVVNVLKIRIRIVHHSFLFQVTKNDEKVMQKEQELKEVKDKLESHEQVVADLDRQYQQALEEKNILAEQLQAETELCAEAEEMRARYVKRVDFRVDSGRVDFGRPLLMSSISLCE